ncbi:MAG: hypothetical protein DWI00_10640 [Planctomycetota bacterium]|nr:MAG: hypothetical protein DWI00_10640 [Planctomycetota bacterium]
MKKEAQRPQRRGKILISLLTVLIFIFLIAAGLYRVYSDLRLNQQLADLKSRGLPTNGEELNAWYAVPPDVQDTTEQWMAATSAIAKVDIYARGKGLPFVGDGPEPVPPGKRWAELEASRAFLKELAPELQLIIAAADAGGMARYPVDFRKGLNAEQPHLNHARNMARLLSVNAHVHAHDELWQDVLKDVKGIFSVSSSLNGEPNSIAQLGCNALHAMGCFQTVSMLPHSPWSDKELEELQIAVGHTVFRKNLQRAFYGELAIGLESLETLPSPSIIGIVVTTNNSRSTFIDLMDSTAKAMDSSWVETVERFFPASLKMMETDIDPVSPVSHIVVLVGLPAFQRFIFSGIRTEARQNCCLAVIAAKRYQLKHGTLPRKLNDLRDFVPGDFKSRLSRLIDPFDGKPLRFKTTDYGVVIYSVSDDRADDGGDVDNAFRVSADLGYLISK